MVELVRAGRDPAGLAREFEPTAQSISHRVAQADRQEGRREEEEALSEPLLIVEILSPSNTADI
jgi:transposase